MIVVLCGGFGAARLVWGLRQAAAELCCVVNTADDFIYLRLHVSPDVDSVLYGLAGCFDEERGWGLRDDTFRCNAELARYGDEWFHVGDADLAQHLKRTALLRAGATLTEATAELGRAWELDARLLPMSDDPVRTVVDTDRGRLALQDYLVRHRAEPAVRAVYHDGLSDAKPSLEVLAALRNAEMVILAPSNPVSSLGPILGLPGVRDVLAQRRCPAVAVTPVVAAAPPTTPAEESRYRVREVFLAARGVPHDPVAVAGLYAGLVDGFVVDERDAAVAGDVEALGFTVLVADTLAPEVARPDFGDRVVRFTAGLHR